MKRLIAMMLIAFFASGFSLNTLAKEDPDNNISWMAARYGNDKSKWPIFDHKKHTKGNKVDVIIGGVKDPNHGLNKLQGHMGNH